MTQFLIKGHLRCPCGEISPEVLLEPNPHNTFVSLFGEKPAGWFHDMVYNAYSGSSRLETLCPAHWMLWNAKSKYEKIDCGLRRFINTLKASASQPSQDPTSPAKPAEDG